MKISAYSGTCVNQIFSIGFIEKHSGKQNSQSRKNENLELFAACLVPAVPACFFPERREADKERGGAHRAFCLGTGTPGARGR